MAVAAGCCPSGTQNGVPSLYDMCNAVYKKFAYKTGILISCEAEIDVTDPSAWEAAVAAGDIQCMPKGRVTPQPPSESTYQYEDCDQSEVTFDQQRLIDIESIWVAEDCSETDYWCAFFEDVGQYNFIMRDCAGCFYLPKEQIDQIKAGNTVLSNIGFPFSITKTPNEENESGLLAWKTQIKLSEGGVLKKMELPGVNDVLCC